LQLFVNRLRVRHLVMTAALLLAAAAPASAAGRADATAARIATGPFHDIATATDAGYRLFTDAAGIACIDQPGEGGMGIHYVNGPLVGDGKVDAATPELLVYAPQLNGRLKLVALEYVVPQALWDPAHDGPPRLYGRNFELVGAGNRYGLDPFYELHAWLWKPNPNGMFDDWNPRVICPAA